MFNQQIEEVVKLFLEDSKQLFEAYLDSNNRNASGATKRSLDVATSSDDTLIKGAFTAGSWVNFVVDGRSSGPVPIEVIRQWCNDKGIDEKYAYAIQRTIEEKGTKLYRKGGDPIIEQINSDERNEILLSNINKVAFNSMVNILGYNKK